MTRPGDQLRFTVPQRLFTQGQCSLGHRHVYGQGTRFIAGSITKRLSASSQIRRWHDPNRRAPIGIRAEVAANVG
jgi:hypothetical protein